MNAKRIKFEDSQTKRELFFKSVWPERWLRALADLPKELPSQYPHWGTQSPLTPALRDLDSLQFPSHLNTLGTLEEGVKFPRSGVTRSCEANADSELQSSGTVKCS